MQSKTRIELEQEEIKKLLSSKKIYPQHECMEEETEKKERIAKPERRRELQENA